MPYRCNRCGRLWNDGDATDNEFLCTRKCGGNLVRVPADEGGNQQDTAMPDGDLNLSNLPSILALPLHEYDVEKHPVIRLWHACDAVELTLRFTVMAGLADLARRGPLPDAPLRQLRDRIEKPSLGKWQGMAEAVISFLTSEETVLPELRSLVEDHLDPLLNGAAQPRTADTSLSALRNQLAHGGGVTKAVAARLLEKWKPRMEAFAGALAWTADISLVIRTPTGQVGILRGPQPQPEPWQPPAALAATVAAAFARGDEVLLVRGANVLTLWPLTLFGQPRSADPDAEPSAEVLFQVYVRRGDVDLHFTPLGSETCPASEGDEKAYDAFRALFRLDVDLAEAHEKGFEVRGFEIDLRKDAGELVGRTQELDTIRQKLVDQCKGGVLWLTGPAGIGKSFLVAAIAAELLEKPPEGTVVLAYRFKAGNDRCSRESFLRFAIERLRMALPEAPKQDGIEGQAKGDDEKQDTSARGLLKELKKCLGALAGRKVLIILDGLDEIVERDTRFAVEIPLALNFPDVFWFCAGRPERGLPEAFSKTKCVHIFPDGVPPMDTEDVRTMLLEQIGPLRNRLLAQDREQSGQVNNAFVSKVSTCAQGLPLYVRYVVNDIMGLKFRVLDAGERLPPSLDRYHEELLRRCAVGILHQVVTPLVATLAVSLEPLSAAALKDILSRGNVLPDDEEALPLIRRALAAVASMIRRGVTPEGNEGYTLYHHSLRQHMESSADMAPALKTARRNLANLAQKPGAGLAAPYLFRHGINHLLETNRRDEALKILTSFVYLMARLQALPDPEGIQDLLADWQTAAAGPLDTNQRLWEAFFRERANILRRGNERWPAYKILLQLAVEHADDSPVTKQAEVWLEQGRCNWHWLRNARRIPQAAPDPCRIVLEGHTESIGGALLLPDGCVLSWSEFSPDNALRIWDIKTGACRMVLEGHTESVEGALVLPDGGVLSWSWDNSLRVWDIATGMCRAVLEGHTGGVDGALLLPDGSVLSWSHFLDNTLRIWDTTTGVCRAVLAGHTKDVNGALVLPDAKILSWSMDRTLRVWDTATGKLKAVIAGHTGSVLGALALPDGEVLSWSSDQTLRVSNSATGECRKLLAGHTNWVKGALVLSNGTVLSWGLDDVLRVWNVTTGTCCAVLAGHKHSLSGALLLPDGSVLSWSCDGDLRVWNAATGDCCAVLVGHRYRVNGALLLPDGSVLSWSWDKTLRVWDATRGVCRVVLGGHTKSVNGALVLSASGVISWGDDTLRVWDIATGACIAGLEGHTGPVFGALALPDGGVLSWSGNPNEDSQDNTLRVWNVATGVSRVILNGHSETIRGALVLPDGGILSWSKDSMLRSWDITMGMCRAVFGGHTSSVRGALVLPDGGILSWSSDRTLRIWDAASGACKAVLVGHTKPVDGALVLPDGGVLSWAESHNKGATDNTLRVWDASTGAIRGILEGHTESVEGALLLSDGSFLSWSWDKTLRIWDAKTGKCRAVLEGHTEWVAGALLLSDGSFLSWSWDKTLRIWDVATGLCKAVMKGHRGRIFGAVPLPGLGILSWAEDATLRVWDVITGACHVVVTEDDAPFQRPDLVAARASVSALAGWVAGNSWNVMVLASITTPLRAAWQAACSCRGRAVFPDGTVVTTLDDGHVFFLKLHQGARRVTLTEALAAQLDQ